MNSQNIVLWLNCVIVTVFGSIYGPAGWRDPVCHDENTECKLVTECLYFYDKLTDAQTKNPTLIFQLLNRINCGFIGKIPKICGPKDCQTAIGNKGVCRDANSCLTIGSGSYSYYEVSTCKGNGVCCPLESQPADETKRCISTALPDRSRECCGIEAYDDKINNGEATRVDQYTWLVHIEYRDKSMRCGGSLISGRYVLTAGHCTDKNMLMQSLYLCNNHFIDGEATRVDQYTWLVHIEYRDKSMRCGGSLISGRYVLTAGHCTDKNMLIEYVVLGDYDMANEGADCAEVPGGGEDCTEGEEKKRVEKIITHPHFSMHTYPVKNDIALLRLAELVRFTDFIKPICLPTADFTVNAPEYLVVMGWGEINETSVSDVKMAARLPYIDREKCSKKYKNMVAFSNSTICAGGKSGHCRGDSGGPLVHYNGGQYEIAGVVSFGPVACETDYPGIYTKVKDYLDWINKTMEYYN